MTRIHPREIAAACIVLIATAMPATAQVRGSVFDPADRPVADARVELWISSRRVEATRTDEAGRFEIPGGDASGALMLTVRRLGLATQTVVLASRDTTLRVSMDVQAVALAPLTVEASARPCPRPDDPRARALWTRMRRRYWQPGDDTVLVFAFRELRTGRGEPADAYDPEAGGTTAGWTTGALVEAYPELMPRSGYATRGGSGGERAAAWTYRALDHGSVQDFTTSFFGTAHTLSFAGSSSGRTLIAFCPRERLGRIGQIQGTLTFGSDTTLESARWSFRTPQPDEDAGGEASYLRPDPALGRALLARETVFWRRSAAREYYFEARSFTGWRRWYPADAAQPVQP